jgi:hypothetical protein
MNSLLRELQSLIYSWNSQLFVKPGGSLSCMKELSIFSYRGSDESSAQYLPIFLRVPFQEIPLSTGFLVLYAHFWSLPYLLQIVMKQTLNWPSLYFQLSNFFNFSLFLPPGFRYSYQISSVCFFPFTYETKFQNLQNIRKYFIFTYILLLYLSIRWKEEDSEQSKHSHILFILLHESNFDLLL